MFLLQIKYHFPPSDNFIFSYKKTNGKLQIKKYETTNDLEIASKQTNELHICTNNICNVAHNIYTWLASYTTSQVHKTPI